MTRNRDWVFVFPWKSPPLHLNQRLHHMAKAKVTAELRESMRHRMWAECRRVPDLEHVTVELEWVVSDRRRRDDENPVPTLKALCDGLVDAEVVPDDTAEFMTKRMPTIRYEKGATAHFVFTVTEGKKP